MTLIKVFKLTPPRYLSSFLAKLHFSLIRYA